MRSEEIYNMLYKNYESRENQKEARDNWKGEKTYVSDYREKQTIVGGHKIQKISVPILQKMIRDMQSNEPEPLPEIGSKVVGNLFDRIRFLKERMREVQNAIVERKNMNMRFNKEIDKDIEELEKVLPTISDREELREFKLNITLLRMEKRKENTIFWRDIFALRKQLEELSEEYKIETKISNLFSTLNPG